MLSAAGKIDEVLPLARKYLSVLFVTTCVTSPMPPKVMFPLVSAPGIPHMPPSWITIAPSAFVVGVFVSNRAPAHASAATTNRTFLHLSLLTECVSTCSQCVYQTLFSKLTAGKSDLSHSALDIRARFSALTTVTNIFHISKRTTVRR